MHLCDGPRKEMARTIMDEVLGGACRFNLPAPRKMMRRWADYLTLRIGAQIISLHG